MTVAASVPSGFVDRHGGFVAAVTGSPLVYFNELFVDSSNATAQDFEAAAAALAGTGLPHTVRLQRGLDDRFAESAAAAGYARPH